MSSLRNALLVLAFLALPAPAQSLNVDFENGNTTFGRPPPSYGAAAQSKGFWNSASTDPAAALRSLHGGPTSIALSSNSPPMMTRFGQFNFPGTAGADESLLDDFFTDDENLVEIAWTFSGLGPGDYDVYTICLPSSPGATGLQVAVDGSPDGWRFVFGSWSGAYVEGQNYARHAKTVTDGTLRVRVAIAVGHDYPDISINGIQLVRSGDELTGMPLCPGSASACPCSNEGDAGLGCENSASTGGAFLAATGTISPDTVVLHASGELPSALTIFLQGSVILQPVPFGDGARCVGGPLLRLYTKGASAGYAFAPAPGEPSILARCAALGAPVAPGHRRYYQAYYRDPNTGFCAPPQGSSFNASSAVKINW